MPAAKKRLRPKRSPRLPLSGGNYYITTIRTDRKIRSHIRQLEALGYAVTLAPAT